VKKLLFLLAILVFMLAACQKAEPPGDMVANQPDADLIEPDNNLTSAIPSEPPKEYSYKIGIYTDMHADEPESISMLKAEEQYKNRIYMQYAAYLPDTYTMPEQEVLVNEALQFITDNKINVLLFITAGYMYEPADFLKTLKEYSPDTFYIAIYCYPWRLASGVDDRLMDYADLELSTDQKATAVKAVEKARQMGAATCLDYTFRDNRYRDSDSALSYIESRILPEIREIIKAECVKQDMEYVDVLMMDPASDLGGGPGVGVNFNTYSVEKEIPKYGHNFCVLSSICDITFRGLSAKCIIVHLCHPSLFHVRWKDYMYGIVDNKNHFGDLEWTIEQMKAELEKKGMSGRFATWRVPFPMAAVSAAVEYAIDYCEGSIKSKDDLEAMRECFQKSMEMYNAGDIGFELNRDPEHENHFMFTEDYIVF